ncbi:hypothetical protein N9N13_03325 [Opitutales bacterium]|jgi:hypothetical protein|nr:hypothetical protein [Opitutales bacterium]
MPRNLILATLFLLGFPTIWANPKLYKFTEFKSFNSVYYNPESGKPSINFSFSEIKRESPKIGFLKLAIPFFFIEDLNVVINLEQIDSERLFADLKTFQQREAIRFISGRRVSILFHSNFKNSVSIIANSLKFTKVGQFKVSGKVQLRFNEKDYQENSIILHLNEGESEIKIMKEKGINNLYVFHPFKSLQKH